AIGLKTSRDRPGHLIGLEDIDILVHYGDVLDVIMTRECAKDYVFGFPVALLFDPDKEVITAHPPFGQMHIEDVRECLPEPAQDRRLTRNAAEHEVLQAAADDRVKEGAAPLCDEIDF